MATQTSAFGPAQARSPITEISGVERRSEPRFGADGEVAVMVFSSGRQLELQAKLLDFSLHGLRIEMESAIEKGAEVHVFFSWGEATTRAMWSTPTKGGFEIGLQLF
jgi:hypothetical protein